MQRASSVVVFDAQAERGQALADQLRAQGHAGARASRDWTTLEWASIELLIVRGTGGEFDWQELRAASPSTWLLAIATSEQLEAALAAGVDDGLGEPAELAQIELRLRVALRTRATLGQGGGPLRSVVEALRASEASLRSLLHAIPDGIVVHRGGRFVFVNPTAMEQLGIEDAAAARGRSVYDFVMPEELDSIRARIERMVETGESVPPRDVQFQRLDGEIYVGEVASIRASFEGEPAVITLVRDVTEQRRIQSRMFLADRLATIGTLTVGVAHEINNPLAWVVGNLGLLADEFDNQVRMRELPGHDRDAVAASRARVRELLGRAQEGTERVRRIVRDLGRFGRVDEGADEVVDVHALLDSSIEIADVQIRHRARVTRDYRGPRFARGSAARLGQVFLNLLVNAGQAIEPGSPRHNQVSVLSSRLADGRVEVAIEDTGSGMPESVRKRIFEPFFTTKPVGEGTGIGLAISHDIVTSMGGEILVESEVGKGTVFRVRLQGAEDVDAPQSRVARAVRDDSEPHRAAAPAAVRVLIVDDEPMIREMVCDALSQHEVTAVGDGRAALEQIEQHDWDLILCDMFLPELSGLDVYRELEQRRPEVLEKLVFMTGGDFSRKVPRLPSGAGVRLLDKPFSLKKLRALVKRARPAS